MDSLSKVVSDLLSWHWWFTVVIAGTAINLVSSYLKPWLDSHFAKRSESKRKLADQKEAAWSAKMVRLSRDPTLLILEANNEHRYLTSALLMIVMATLAIALGVYLGSSPVVGPTISVLLGVIGGGAYVLALYFLDHATKARRNVNVATRIYVTQKA